jgi:hypothetical protein
MTTLEGGGGTGRRRKGDGTKISFIGNTFPAESIIRLVLELHRLTDQIDHDFSVERMVQQLQVDEQGVLRIGGAERD